MSSCPQRIAALQLPSELRQLDSECLLEQLKNFVQHSPYTAASSFVDFPNEIELRAGTTTRPEPAVALLLPFPHHLNPASFVTAFLVSVVECHVEFH